MVQLAKRMMETLHLRRPGRRTGFGVQVKRPRLFLGSSYGGWTVCPEGLGTGSVVYSFGIGKDITFDLELLERFGLEVHAFDPTPESLEWLRGQKLPPNLFVHAYGLASRDGTAMFHPPENPRHVSHSMVHRGRPRAPPVELQVRRLGTLMGMLGHARLDILKMDIEGAEYDVLEDILRTKIRASQLLVEFHDRFPGIGIERTKGAISALNASGYRIFSISDSGEEFSFILEGASAGR